MASQSYYAEGQQQQQYGQPQYNQQQPGYGQQMQYENQNQYGNNQYGNQQKYNAPPTGPPPGYGQPYTQPPVEGSKFSFDQTFKIEKPKYNDLWAGILLIITFLGFVAVSALSLRGFALSPKGGINQPGIGNGNGTSGLNSHTAIMFSFVLVVAFVLSWLYLLAARAFTKTFIWITGILNIVVGVATGIYYLYKHWYGAGIVFLLFSVISVICFISWIPRIPFSVFMLQTTFDVAKNYGHVFMVSLIGGIVAIAFAAWWSLTFVAVYIKYQPDNTGCSASGGSCSSATVIGLLVFITFAAYWISEWLKNTIHTTVAGVYGSWFFCAGKPGGMPSGATRGAFKRAMTYSFGSIAEGSLIVAIINMLRQAASMAQQNEAADGNMVGACLFCCLQCLISILQSVIEWANRYAFSHIALYGKAYIPAAKDTWKMMKNRGIDALVNDLLIAPVLTMGSVFVGFCCALVAFGYIEIQNVVYNGNGAYTAVAMAFSFLIGVQVCQILTQPICSGVDTFFVAAAWDPEVLMRDHPDIYARMVAVYPKVQEAIHA